jgi:hypothetical protein
MLSIFRRNLLPTVTREHDTILKMEAPVSSSPNVIRLIISRRNRWVRHVARMREKNDAYRGLEGKQEGKGLLGNPRRSAKGKIATIAKI